MNSASDFQELTLSKEALKCFAIATLRMMDLDVLSSTSKIRTEKIVQKKIFFETFSSYNLPIKATDCPSRLHGVLRNLKLLKRSHEESLVRRISKHLTNHADEIREKRFRGESKAKENQDRKLIKNLAAEEKMLRAVIPK